MANNPLIPRADSKFHSFQNTLYTAVSANALAWNIPQTAIDELTPLKQNWGTAYTFVIDPATDTKVTRHQKKTARTAYENALRTFIKLHIRYNPSMTDADRAACEISPLDKVRTKVKKPVTTPDIEVVVKAPQKALVHFRQQAGEEGITRRAKPEGVKFCELAYSFDVPPAAPEYSAVKKLTGSSPCTLQFEPAHRGKKIYLYARWINTKGEPGSWTMATEFIIP